MVNKEMKDEFSEEVGEEEIQVDYHLQKRDIQKGYLRPSCYIKRRSDFFGMLNQARYKPISNYEESMHSQQCLPRSFKSKKIDLTK